MPIVLAMGVESGSEEDAADGESAARQAAVDFALASVRVEGLEPDPLCLGLLQDWVTGRLEIETAVAKLLGGYPRGLIAS